MRNILRTPVFLIGALCVIYVTSQAVTVDQPSLQSITTLLRNHEECKILGSIKLSVMSQKRH